MACPTRLMMKRCMNYPEGRPGMNRASSITQGERAARDSTGLCKARGQRFETCPYSLERYMSSSFSTMVWKAVAC